MNTRRVVLLDIGGVIPEKFRDAVLEFLAKMLGLKTILYKTGRYSILEPGTPQEIPARVARNRGEIVTAVRELMPGHGNA